MADLGRMRAQQDRARTQERRAIAPATRETTASYTAQERKAVPLRLDPDLHRRLRVYSAETGESAQQLLERLLRDHLDSKG